MKVERYEHAASGGYADTVAVLADGRRLEINTQYSIISPLVAHSATCDQVCKMGGRCNCGLLDGVDAAALVAHARLHGKRGPAPLPPMEPRKLQPDTVRPGLCPLCRTYCCGDCRA